MKSSQLKLGSVLSYVQMGFGIIIGLVYTPIMIQLLGKSEYGLYNTVASTVSMLSVLNLGFNSSYIRYFSKYKRENNQDAVSKLNGLFLLIFLIIGFIAFICGLYLDMHLELVFNQGLTQQEYSIAKILMLLLTVNLSISFPMSVFTSIISANERFVFLKLLGVIKTVVSPLVTWPLLLMGFRSIAMVAVTVAVTLFADILYAIYVLKILKERFIFHGFEKGMFRSLFAYTSFIAINMIVDQINLNIDKVLLGRFKGTESVAVYSVGYTLYSYYTMFSTSVSGVFTPRIHKIVNETRDKLLEQKRQLTKLFVQVGRIQLLILGLIASGIVFFGKVFIINFWAGAGYEDSYYVTLLLVIPASIALIQNLGIEIQRAENKHQFRSVVYLFMALINLGLSIILCQKFGAVGSAVGTAISLILANGLVMNVYYQKKCNIDIILFWKSISGLLCGMIIPIIVGILLVNNLDVNSLLKFLSLILIYSVVYFVSMWFIGMNSFEKKLILKPIKKILVKINRD